MSEVVVRPIGKVRPPLSGACTMEAVVMDRTGGHDGADCPGAATGPQTGCTRRKELLIRSPGASESPSATSALRAYSYKELAETAPMAGSRWSAISTPEQRYAIIGA